MQASILLTYFFKDDLRRSQVQRTVTAAFSILMKCNHEKAMREFILSLALDRGRPPIENMLIDKEWLQLMIYFLQVKKLTVL